MLLNLGTIDICIYMLKNVKYAKICKISLHICNRDFMNQIYVVLGYNSGCAKKICRHKHPSSSYNILFYVIIGR
jgi:hypothetical protein